MSTTDSTSNSGVDETATVTQAANGDVEPERPRKLWSKLVFTAVAGLVALSMAALSGPQPAAASRSGALAELLQRRGLRVEEADVIWLEQPPLSLWRSVMGSVPAVVRAKPAEGEPHDIFLVQAKLSPEGVLLELGGVYNLTETSAVDEQRPVGRGSRFAFVEGSVQAEREGATIRLFNLASGAVAVDPASNDSSAEEPTADQWTRLQRLQAAITRLQKTGRLGGVGRWAYTIQSGGADLSLALTEKALVVEANGQVAQILFTAPDKTPNWLTAVQAQETKPGKLVTWAVDRVRAIPWVGDNTMQYIKAVFFTVYDFVLRNKEAVTGDTGEEDIAADLGQESLEPPTRAIPVDPEIGFPPSLDIWVKPALPGEGRWSPKDKDPFIHTMAGLPPVFYTTFIRSDRRRQATRVYIALWDPRQVELHTMAGVAEPKSATGATGPGLIPRAPEVMSRVAAACNAGFQSLHGEYGMMSDGVLYLPAKPYAATVAVLRDGSTAFGSWPIDPTIPDDMLSFRQNMTVMVLDQKFNPYGRTWWGGTPPDWEDKTHTTRTGICLTKENFVGYFYGMDLSPKALSRAMILARCNYGIALDMNAGHSGLEYYRVAPVGQFEPLDRHLRRDWEREGKVPYMDGWEFRARRLVRGMGLMYFPRYIKREGRDFFYLTMRHLLPGEPIAVESTDPSRQPSPWQVKGLPQHGYPYALAAATVPLEGGGRVRVLKIDPRMVTPFAQHAVPSVPEQPSKTESASADRPGAVTDAGVVEPSSDAAGAEAEAGIAAEHADGGEPKDEQADAAPQTHKPLVAVFELSTGTTKGDVLSLWYTPDAFSVAQDAPISAAVRLATGQPSADGPTTAVAALGVQEAAGMLIYLELQALTGQDAEIVAPAPTRELVKILKGMGVTKPVILAARLPIALGGDTELGGKATRLPGAARQISLYRAVAPGARRIFNGTPIVPFKEWYPLQARRIRYFKKRKKKTDSK